MESSLLQAVHLIVTTVAGFFSILFLLRFFMQMRRVSFANPLGHFVVQLTNWGVKPLRRLVPGLGGYDWASIIAAYLVQLLCVTLIMLLISRINIPIGAALFLSLGVHALRALLQSAVHMLIVLLMVHILLSWVKPFSPLAGPVAQMVHPVLAPIRRILPTISGIDLSPMVAFLVLQVILIFL